MLLERAGGRVAEGWHRGDTQTGTENSAWSQGLPKSPSVLSLPGPVKVPSLHTPPGAEGHPHRWFWGAPPQTPVGLFTWRFSSPPELPDCV